MKYNSNLPRTIVALALIATGTFCMVSRRASIDSVALGSELSPAARVAQTSNAMPTFENAKLESKNLAAALSDEISRWAGSATAPQWLAYAVPAVDGQKVICCGGGGDWNGYRDCGPCHLEDRNHAENFTSGPPKGKLEGPRSLIVLFRAEHGKLGKIRVASEDCILDAGGLHVTWLTGVNPARSVEYLASFVLGKYVEDRYPEDLAHGALTAIAMHGDASADKAMSSFVEPSQPESLRKQTAFWLGEARGASGFQTLKQLARSEKSAEVRSHLTFALSVSRESGAIDEMIRMAHEDESTQVRGQALFWIAQKAGQKAAATISGAIENDPDEEVKKKAVFALTQMPDGEGVPKLIQVAQTNKNPEVRKQAMFWLGQSQDPRALDFFEKILSR